LLIKLLMNISYGIKKLLGVNVGKYLLHSVLEAANISTIRVAICGGGPLASSIFKGYNALGIDFIQGYGLTETSPIIALNPMEHFKIESVGMDFSPWEEIKILDPNEQGIGEIAVKGPMVMQGYYNMPYETQEMFTKDGFLKTGDLGWMDSEHYLMLSGRAKNLIVTEGGKNVYPEEIEDAFQLYYDVEQIMVRGYVANEETKSEEIEALIYPADDMLARLSVERSEAAADQKVYDEIKLIVDKVNKNLQPYARISKITILNEPLEMTTTRKIKRGAVGKIAAKAKAEGKKIAAAVKEKVDEEAPKVKAKAKAVAKKVKKEAPVVKAKTKAEGEKIAKTVKTKVAPKVKAEAKKISAAVKKEAPKAKAKIAAAAKKAKDEGKKVAAKAKTAIEKKKAAPKSKAPAKKAAPKTKAPAKRSAAKKSTK
ncbi:MAG: AMP-binding protein, partial [Treponema sp.]|nr:AMP-binding protein [Treponema sp.]